MAAKKTSKKPTPIQPKSPNALNVRNRQATPQPGPPPKANDLLFKKLVEAGEADLKNQAYEEAEETFFHARTVGLTLGKTAEELKPARVGYLKAISELLKEQ